MTSIPEYTFSETGLTSITISSSVSYIASTAFDLTTALTAVNVDGANKVYKSIDGILYTKDGTELIRYPQGKTGSMTISRSVTSIGDYAFSGCSGLKSVIIPDGVTSIGASSFVACTGLTSVLIPDSVTIIPERAFANAGLTSITIPKSVTNIGYYAFYGCGNLSDAYFYGDAPELHGFIGPGEDDDAAIYPFDECAPGFTAHYISTNTGFTNPWSGYTTVGDITLIIPTPTVSYQTHVQDIGWQGYVSNGAASGTSGQSKRLEGIKIKLDLEGVTGGIEYRTHVQDIGWQDWVANDALSGTSGQSKRLEAIEIRLTGESANLYDVYYRVHAQNTGWMDWAKNGASSGTAGYGYRLEAIEIKLVEKGAAAPGATATPFIERGASTPTGGSVSYKTHVQDIGWQAYVSNGAESGTSGQSKRLEGIQIKLANVAGGIEYSTHIQDIGWQGFVADDAMSGTSGQSKRLEAIKIRLTGAAADAYDVYYCVHAQNTGWLDWAKNGESAGTAGFGYRLEAIKVVLVPKGGPAPGATARPFVQG